MIMYVSVGQRAEEKRCESLHKLTVSASCEILFPALRVPANLVVLMFLIFERPIQILFRVHLASV